MDEASTEGPIKEKIERGFRIMLWAHRRPIAIGLNLNYFTHDMKSSKSYLIMRLNLN